MTRPPTIKMPSKRLLNDKGKPIPRPFMTPPPGWATNPNDPNEAVRIVGALGFSVRQNLPVPGGGQMTAVTALNLPLNRAASHYFKEPIEAFAYCDLVLSAASYERGLSLADAMMLTHCIGVAAKHSNLVTPEVVERLTALVQALHGQALNEEPEVADTPEQALDTKPDPE